jgi:hypothetical protein
MELVQMKRLAMLMLVLVCIAAGAWQPIEKPSENNKNKICWVGNSGTYIREQDECIDTEARCKAKGGLWGGNISGRGRSPGCSLPTKDAGQACSDSSQCESVCVAHDTSNKNCSCYNWTVVPKGPQPDSCSFKGIIPGAIDD